MVEQDRSHGARRITRARLYEQLMERILEFIGEEGLAPGDRLQPLDLTGLKGARTGSLAGAETLDLRARWRCRFAFP